MSSEIKTLSADEKQLLKLYGVRETHRIIADRLQGARLARQGLKATVRKMPPAKLLSAMR